MTSLEKTSAFLPTSAAGAMLASPVPHVFVGWGLADVGTSTARQRVEARALRAIDQTSAGAAVPAAPRAGAAIGELRLLTGLTWEQLAGLFQVSRRSLHFWSSGKPMASSHEEHLQRILAVVRRIDRGSAAANRAALLCAGEDGLLPLDLLAAKDFERVLALLGPGSARRGSPPKLSEQARAARAPRPPEELVGALQDRVHPTSGPLIAARTISIPRSK